MRRLLLFLGAQTWGGWLHLLVIAIILGRLSWLDFQLGHMPVTVGLAIFSWLFGWAMKSVMAAHPRSTSRIISVVGIAVFVLYVFAGNKKWMRLLITRFAYELFLWLDLFCDYWFVSEVRLQQERQANEIMIEQFGQNKIDHGDRFDFRNDDFGDRPESSRTFRN